VSDATFKAVMAELDGMNDGFTDEDANGVIHDERIHTKNKSKHDKREMGICVGWRVTDCSNVANFDRSTVNYDYYVEQAEKLVKPLVQGIK